MVAMFVIVQAVPSRLLNYALHHDEALSIYLGRAALQRAPCDGACAQHTGSVMMQPMMAAAGDRWGGLFGARLVSVGFGVLLLVMVAATGWQVMGAAGGLLSGALLLAQAPFLYVSRMALYDVVSTAWLAAATMCLVAAERQRKQAVAGWWLLGGALSLAAACLAKYVTAIYLLPALAIVLWRWPLRQALICFVAPLAVLGGWYVSSALWPVLPDVLAQLHNVASRGQATFDWIEIVEMLIRWLIWPAVFAMAALGLSGKSSVTSDGHRPRAPVAGLDRQPAGGFWVVLIAMAFIMPVVHLATGSVQGLNKNVVQSLLFLSPAAAFGFWSISRAFHIKRGVNAQGIVIGLVLLLMFAGGLRNRAWLERQYPDLGPVVAELRQLVTPQTVVMTDTDALFRYALEDRLPPAQVVLTYWVDIEGMSGELGAVRFVEAQRPDYVVLDGYYGQAAQHERLKQAMGANYQLRRQWPMRMSWGERTVELYERKGVTG
jgi:MFS family permease